MSEPPEDLLHCLRAARRVVALTGAGMSAESGVPTFRAAQTGLWARFDPMDLATPEAFDRDPVRVWQWYAWRRELVGRVAPNAGHRALADWGRRAHVTIVTQNVDGLHQQAGSAEVIELHGNLRRSVCSAGCGVQSPGAGEPPPCPQCGAPLRPDVVWFGELLPEGALESAMAVVQAADLVLSVGSSNQVQPAAELPFLALRNGCPVAEVNPEATPLSAQADWSLRGTAAALLPRLAAAASRRGAESDE